MLKNYIKSLTNKILFGFVILSLLFAYLPSTASAAQITARSVAIGSSVASVNTTYTFEFTVPSATVIKSASFTACTTASGVCTPVPGFSAGSSTVAQPINLGDAAGWTVNTSTVNSLRLSKTANTAAPSSTQTVVFSNVTNPSATNATFFIRMSTFSDDAYTTLIDTGTVASSTAGQVTITADVDETLTFTLALSSISLGKLSKSFEGKGTSSMTVGTNGTGGYSVSYAGSTLTSGVNTIDPMLVRGVSNVNNEQFGLNLMANAAPAIGTGVSGVGSGAPALGYGVQNEFKFTSGDTIASASTATDDNTFTTSYIANIDSSTEAGSYTTILTYTATANF